VKQLTHVNYAFANVTEEGRVVLGMEGDSSRLAALTDLRDRSSGFDLLLSIGGWEWSDHFSDAALTDASRERFARTAVRLLDKHDLDGLDIDWEYPGQEGQDNEYRSEDKENFTRLLRTVRRHLDEHAAREGRDDAYLLTIAAGAGPSFVENTNMAAAQAPLDFVNLMTYDYHGSWTEHTGHHANLHPPAPPDTAHPQRAASRAVDLFLEAGVPADKLVLGVPFYGRAWGGVEPEDNRLYQSYSSPREGFLVRHAGYPHHRPAGLYASLG
jgi:chitinase